MLYEEPECKGAVSQDKNAVINLGKNRAGAKTISPCQIEQNRTAGKILNLKNYFYNFYKNFCKKLFPASTTSSIQIPPTESSFILPLDTSIKVKSPERDVYDLSDFPDEGEFEPWKPLKRNDTPAPSVTGSTILTVRNSSDFGRTLNANGGLVFLPTDRRDDGQRRPHPMDTHSVISCPRKCEATDRYGIHWEVCLSGTGFRPCPGNNHGSVVWQCGSDGRFIQRHPNYSECHSNWMTEAESSILVVVR